MLSSLSGVNYLVIRGSPSRPPCRVDSFSKRGKFDSEMHPRIPFFPVVESMKFSVVSGELLVGEFSKGFVDVGANGFCEGGSCEVGEGSVMVIPTVSLAAEVSVWGFGHRGSNSDKTFEE